MPEDDLRIIPFAPDDGANGVRQEERQQPAAQFPPNVESSQWIKDLLAGKDTGPVLPDVPNLAIDDARGFGITLSPKGHP